MALSLLASSHTQPLQGWEVPEGGGHTRGHPADMGRHVNKRETHSSSPWACAELGTVPLALCLLTWQLGLINIPPPRDCV